MEERSSTHTCEPLGETGRQLQGEAHLLLKNWTGKHSPDLVNTESETQGGARLAYLGRDSPSPTVYPIEKLTKGWALSESLRGRHSPLVHRSTPPGKSHRGAVLRGEAHSGISAQAKSCRNEGRSAATRVWELASKTASPSLTRKAPNLPQLLAAVLKAALRPCCLASASTLVSALRVCGKFRNMFSKPPTPRWRILW